MNFYPKIEYIELLTGTPKTILFDSPPEGDPFKEKDTTSSTITTSNNGTEQTQFNYTKRSYDLEFIFQTKVTKEAFQDFFNNHGVRGGEFNYFPSNDEVEFNTFKTPQKEMSYGRPIPDASDDFEYDFKFKVSRVL